MSAAAAALPRVRTANEPWLVRRARGASCFVLAAAPAILYVCAALFCNDATLVCPDSKKGVYSCWRHVACTHSVLQLPPVQRAVHPHMHPLHLERLRRRPAVLRSHRWLLVRRQHRQPAAVGGQLVEGDEEAGGVAQVQRKAAHTEIKGATCKRAGGHVGGCGSARMTWGCAWLPPGTPSPGGQ